MKRRKNMMFSTYIISYVSFKYKQLTTFCFYCRRLGHTNSFCQAKMTLGYEIAETGWDLSLHAQTRRTWDLHNIWLWDDKSKNNYWDKRGVGKRFDPMMRLNLEGDSGIPPNNKNELALRDESIMEHDLEDNLMIGSDRKKRRRVSVEANKEGREMGSIVTKNKNSLVINSLLSTATKGQADRSQWSS